jgi:hypothetical protein
MNWIDEVSRMTGEQWLVVAMVGSALAWVVVLVVWFKRTNTKKQ